MLKEEICKLRDRLNYAIENNEEYSIIYELSIKLDKLIEQYYSAQNKVS